MVETWQKENADFLRDEGKLIAKSSGHFISCFVNNTLLSLYNSIDSENKSIAHFRGYIWSYPLLFCSKRFVNCWNVWKFRICIRDYTLNMYQYIATILYDKPKSFNKDRKTLVKLPRLWICFYETAIKPFCLVLLCHWLFSCPTLDKCRIPDGFIDFLAILNSHVFVRSTFLH